MVAHKRWKIIWNLWGGIYFKGTNEADTLENEPINRMQHRSVRKEEKNMFHQE